MRAVFLFFLLIAVAVIAWFVAVKAGYLDNPFERTPTEETQPPALPQDPADDPEETGISLPRFDIVRVDRSGNAQIAGNAAPGSTVTIYANGEVLAEETADGIGDWAVFTDTPLAEGPVELTLSMTTEDGFTVEAEDSVIIYVPGKEGRPLVLRTTPGGASEVLQDPFSVDPSMGPLALETIDYDDSGSVIFTGRATKGTMVQVFANNRFVNQVEADANGRWRIVGSVEPGRYTLQVIQLDEFGKPAYALEVPFERASYNDVLFKDGNVIVQPGNSLWVISRRAYGEGAQYTVIYAANADQIRDPDLIYPGQIFSVPETEGADESDDGENSGN